VNPLRQRPCGQDSIHGRVDNRFRLQPACHRRRSSDHVSPHNAPTVVNRHWPCRYPFCNGNNGDLFQSILDQDRRMSLPFGRHRCSALPNSGSSRHRWSGRFAGRGHRRDRARAASAPSQISSAHGRHLALCFRGSPSSAARWFRGLARHLKTCRYRVSAARHRRCQNHVLHIRDRSAAASLRPAPTPSPIGNDASTRPARRRPASVDYRRQRSLPSPSSAG